MAPKYEEKEWPKDYWPQTPEPPSAKAWDESIAAVKQRWQIAITAKKSHHPPLKACPAHLRATA